MDWDKFSSLPIDKQLNIAFEKGKYILHKMTDDMILGLFELESFYVAILTLRDTGKVSTVKVFENADQLHPFLAELENDPLL